MASELLKLSRPRGSIMRAGRLKSVKLEFGRYVCVRCSVNAFSTGSPPMISRLRAEKSPNIAAIHIRFFMTGSSDIKIDHLGIAVRSLDQSLKFYRDQLGLEVSARETVEHEKVNVAMLPLGQPRIELLEPTEQDSVIGKFLDKHGEGLHHVAIRVPDLAASVEKLKASGARLLNEPRKGAGGHLYVFVHPSSTGGVLLELIQE